jgi:glyoxylase-like metal-dependent hydrolase (beta-lactamase superfamily II)
MAEAQKLFCGDLIARGFKVGYSRIPQPGSDEKATILRIEW